MKTEHFTGAASMPSPAAASQAYSASTMPLMAPRQALLCLSLVLLASSTLTALRTDAAETARPTVLRVGAERDLKTPSAAAQIARDGDTVEIDAGDYPGDAAIWRQHRLTIRGVGGRARLRAEGASAEGKAIWVIKGSDVTVESVEFSGAKVPDGNGAGIRIEGANLRIRDCYFHDNENGILAAPNPASDLVVERSEFAGNGVGDGYTHNLYIGNVRSFTLRFSYVHHALVGHNVKSRAQRTNIVYNRIMHEKDGRSSYAIDLPDGGLAFVIGNLIQHGPATENTTMISFGVEGLQHPLNQLYFVNNTVVNDRPGGGLFLFVKTGSQPALILNNIFSGAGEVLSGPGELHNNVIAPKSDFLDAADFDYRLRAGAAAVGRGADPGRAHDFALRPTAEYVHPARGRARRGSERLDAGALEYQAER